MVKDIEKMFRELVEEAAASGGFVAAFGPLELVGGSGGPAGSPAVRK